MNIKKKEEFQQVTLVPYDDNQTFRDTYRENP